MGRHGLVAVRMPVCQHMLDEADSVGSAKMRQFDHPGSEAMIEEPVGEAQHVIDGAQAQAALLDEIGSKSASNAARAICAAVNGTGCATPISIRCSANRRARL